MPDETVDSGSSSESAILDAPDAASPAEGNPGVSNEPSPTPPEQSVSDTPDISSFEKLSGIKLGDDKGVAPKAPLSADKVVKENKEEVEIEAEVKDEVKVENEEEVVPTAQVQPKKIERDFAGLTPEEITNSKHMSPKSFLAYKNVILDNKKIKGEIVEKDKLIKDLQSGKEMLPPNYYENPEAVVLSPSYRAAAKNAELSGVIINHWEQQLLKIESGEEWQDLDNDPKTGQLMLGQTRPATVSDKIRVMGNLSFAQNQLREFQQEARGLVSNFKVEHSKLVGNIRQAEKEFFPHFEKPDEGATKQLESVKTAIKNVGIAETNPAFTLLMKSGALTLQLSDLLKLKEKELADIKKSEQTKLAIKKDSIKAGPSSSALTSGSGSPTNGTPVPTYDEFAKLLQP